LYMLSYLRYMRLCEYMQMICRILPNRPYCAELRNKVLNCVIKT
jgi:hypothetical protein